MPLRPEGARLLVIRSSDGTVLYEGDGRVQRGVDPFVLPVPGPDEPRQVWSFEGPAARDGARHWAVPGTRNARWEDPDDQEAERSWGELVRSMTEQAAQTRAQGLASAVQQILEAYGLGPEILGPPVHVQEYWDEMLRLAHRVNPDEVPRDVRDAVLDTRPAWQERFWTGAVRAEVALEEFQRAVTEPVPAYDDLVESTRAEFPYDPLDYGRFGREQMTWFPPEDGQEVPRCP